jgi:hypothetical protein
MSFDQRVREGLERAADGAPAADVERSLHTLLARRRRRVLVRRSGAAVAVWSPDGTQILFLQRVLEGGELRLGLATMRANGAHRAFLSGDPLESHQPDWHAARGGRH